MLDAATVRAWCALALEALGRSRAEIDAINVFPVADGDTGTNLYLTVESAAQAVEAVFSAHDAVADAPPAPADVLRAMAHGALLGARGNSGTILASLLRGLAGPTGEASDTRQDARWLRAGLRRAADAARAAVAHPVEGTMLTVADAAATAAQDALLRDAGAARRGDGASASPRDDAAAGATTSRATTPHTTPHDSHDAALRHDPPARTTTRNHQDAAERDLAGRDPAARHPDDADANADDPIPVARAAYRAACAALDATPGQLADLARAGVVDAGGSGLVAVLGALVDALEGEGSGLRLTAAGRHEVHPLAAAGTREAACPAPIVPHGAADEAADGPTAVPHGAANGPPGGAADGPTDGPTNSPAVVPHGPADGPTAVPHGPANGPTKGPTAIPHGPANAPTDRPTTTPHPPTEGPAYEVIYLLDADDPAVTRLRARLDPLGDSLVVSGGEGLWRVHVHVDDPGAAIDAGIEAGRPYRIQVTHFCAEPAVAGGTDSDAARSVILIVPGGDRDAGLAGLCREAGGVVVAARPGEPPASGELAAAIRRTRAREVVLLPNDPALRDAAAIAVEQAHADGVRAALIPTRSPVQGIAALAVHEPDRRFDEDVVAMTAAAGATRYAEVTVAERQSWTSQGVCQQGDVLGLIDGDVAVIGRDLASTAMDVLDRMLAAGGEMVTLVLGPTAPTGLADHLDAHVQRGHLAVDTVVYEDAAQAAPLLIGVE